MELTTRDKRWIVVVGLIGVTVSACYALAGESDYPLPYKRRDASVLGRIAPDDPFTRTTTVKADDRTITIEVTWSGCDYKPDLVAREAADHVTLLLKRRDASGPGVGCEDGGDAQLKVVLHQPLGTRALVDAVTGKPVPYATTQRQPTTG